MHEHLLENGTIRARGPRNHFVLEAAPAYIFIAGGIGITPILPMIREADATGSDWRLIYLGRSTATMAFRDELEAYGDRVTYWPRDTYKRFDLPGLFANPRDNTLIYACGPENLLETIEELGATWPRGSIRIERFSARPVSKPVLTEAFEVELVRSGITVSVPPSKSVLKVIEEQGIHVLSSCGEGTCGTCDTPVLEGEIDHRDSVLTEEERQANDCMMVCVSRACSKKLVLDL
ncbi:PDR/VanB family oxidoreductase [Pseudarthrobacter sp. NPDC058329]|uniref:PDR/VanB family oxidoreductase n=1 Tax=Pseudarthrobacter sp. NPDC058329 TaxID=3346448 RepID=UPI0036DC957D